MRRSLIAAALAVAGLSLAACGTGTTVTKYPVSGTLVALPTCGDDGFIVFNDGIGPAIKRAGPALAELDQPVNFEGSFRADQSADGRLALTLGMCGPGVDADGTRDGASTVARSFARTTGLREKVGSLRIINGDNKLRIVAEPFDAALFASDTPLTDLRSQWRDDHKEN